MRTPILFAALLMATSLLAACSPQTASMVTSPHYEQPPEPSFPDVNEVKAQWTTEDGGERDFEFNPQVDILFVTDNSDSMRTAQANLVKNIDKFSDGLVKNTQIDYHVGVISTWDNSERFATQKKDPYGIGELRFLKNSKNESSNQRFVTRKEQNFLASTLDIGVAALSDGGPENEEFFAPLMAALDKSGNGAPNDGFFRPEAQLVVILLTDADDSNKDITVKSVVDKLVEFKDGKKEKISVYGALVKASDNDTYKDWALKVHPKYNPRCFDMTKKVPVQNGLCKNGIGPERLEGFILNMNAKVGVTPKEVREKYIMSIISKNFGSDLARIGSDIKVKVLTKEIFLTNVPVVENYQLQLRVRYGTPKELAAGKGQIVPQTENGGWMYNAESNSVRVSGDKLIAGARFAVDLKAVIIKD